VSSCEALLSESFDALSCSSQSLGYQTSCVPLNIIEAVTMPNKSHAGKIIK